MTTEQIKSLNLGLTLDAKTEIAINSGIDWLSENTTIDTADIANIPSCAKLFLIKFAEITSVQSGITSESIEGLSLSYNTGDRANMLWDIAETLLGKYLKGQVRFVPSTNRWR